jgi:hypothetical protein
MNVRTTCVSGWRKRATAKKEKRKKGEEGKRGKGKKGNGEWGMGNGEWGRKSNLSMHDLRTESGSDRVSGQSNTKD